MADGDDDKDAIIAKLRQDEASMRKKLRDAEARNSQLEAAEGDRDKIIAQAKAEGAAEARAALTAEHNRALAGAELKAAAARKLADPEDAVRFLDMTEVVGADGKVDGTKIDTMLTELVEKKPYLAIPAGNGGSGGGAGGGGDGAGGGKPTGSGDGGARPPAPGNADEEVNSMIRKAAGR
jgi:hypothetical protein